APEDLVASAGSGIVHAGGERLGDVEDRVDALELAGTLDEEGPASIMQERRVGGAGQVPQERIALVARRADGVKALIPRAHGARLDVEVTREDLRLEQREKLMSVQIRARHARIEIGAWRLLVPAAHEIGEVPIHDCDAIDAARRLARQPGF